jgi:predicted RNA-binding Zn-ribbon protein involved in translation (DUF1610 family)
VTAAELLDSVKRDGGVIELDGDNLKCRLPKDAVHFANLLREHKQELIELLRACGGRVATFPHCPRCASYALYRRNNTGVYECETCGLQNIDEVTARRVQ